MPLSNEVVGERSIQNAYLDLIAKSQHFIYIENQFFQSGFTGDRIMRNRVMEVGRASIKRGRRSRPRTISKLSDNTRNTTAGHLQAHLPRRARA